MARTPARPSPNRSGPLSAAAGDRDAGTGTQVREPGAVSGKSWCTRWIVRTVPVVPGHWAPCRSPGTVPLAGGRTGPPDPPAGAGSRSLPGSVVP